MLFEKVIAIVAGSFLIGIGVNGFLVPHHLMDGGMIGVGLLAKYYFGLAPGGIMLLTSIPIYGLVFCCDRFLFYRSFHGMLLSSFFIDWLSFLREAMPSSLATASVVGGALIGSGVGIMLAYQSNTGGTDLLAQFLSRRNKVPVALLIFLIDGVIVASSLQAIGLTRMLFSLITIASVAVATHYFSQIGPEPYLE
ncbi:YitT family protein [Brevibacillus fluminis]|uniref:YitT family protein n=1 Tax=Brevibacillus fluminis TaxID=511487 RepID=UPI003F8C6DFE